jgi:hypothetical protein
VKNKSPVYFEACGGETMKVTFPKVTSSNGLTRAVINFLTWEGHHAERTNTMGRPVDKTEKYIDVVGRERVIGSMEWQKGTGTKGSSDIKADIVHKYYRFPIPVKIEVKWNKDKQSKDQMEYEKAIEKSGGVYIIVKTIDGFLDWYDNFLLSLSNITSCSSVQEVI